MKCWRSLIAAVVIITAMFTGSAAAAERRAFPGAWYTDARPNGSCVAVVQGSHLVTCAGQTIGLTPQGDPLFIRLSRDGSRFAGMGWGGGIVYEYVGGQWISNGQGFGNRGVIYNAADQLQIVRGPGEFTGSIGWRFLSDEGQLYSTQDTYDPTTVYARQHGITALWEYTKRGEFYCGQGNQGLQCLIAPSMRRVLVEPGDTQFVNFNREGDRLSFATAKLAQREAVVIFMSAAELNALPTYEEPKPEIRQCNDGQDNDGDGLTDMADPGCKSGDDNDETPMHNVSPEVCGDGIDNDRDGSIDEGCTVEQPKEKHPLPPAVCTALQEERAKYPADLKPFCSNELGQTEGCPLGKILNAVAWRTRGLGIKVNKKDFGYFVSSPVGPIASDILGRKSDNAIWDVITSAGEASNVNCGEGDDLDNDNHVPGHLDYWARRPWLDAVDPGNITDPEPEPGDDVAALKARITALEAENTQLKTDYTNLEIREHENVTRLGADVRALSEQVDKLKGSLADPCSLVTVRAHPGWINAFVGTRCTAKPQQ